jgi:hypothetical protein
LTKAHTGAYAYLTALTNTKRVLVDATITVVIYAVARLRGGAEWCGIAD